MTTKTFTLRIPARWANEVRAGAASSGRSLAAHAKSLCVMGLNAAPSPAVIELAPAPREAGVNLVVTLNAEEQERLALWRACADATGGDVLKDSQLLSALCLHGMSDAPAAARDGSVAVPIDDGGGLLGEVNGALGDPMRGHQSELYRAMRQRLMNSDWKGVIAAEASTGVGKTRAALVASIERLLESPERIGWITAPTLAVLRQWAQELERFEASGVATPRWRIIFGRQEFVCDEALQERIDDGYFSTEDVALIDQWRGRGGRGPNDGLQWPGYLADSLASCLSDDVTITGDMRLSGDDEPDDPAAVAYSAQFNQHDGVQLLLFSHAMLATEIRRRLSDILRRYREAGGNLKQVRSQLLEERRRAKELAGPGDKLESFLLGNLLAESIVDSLSPADIEAGRLKDPDHLIVDEAHQLEQSISNALGEDVALWALKGHASALRSDVGRIPAALLKDLDFTYGVIRSMLLQQPDGLGRPLSLRDSRMEPVVRSFADALRGVLKVKLPRNYASRHLSVLRKAGRVMNLVFPEGRAGYQAFLRGSPVLGHPQLVCGRGDLGIEMGLLWSTIAPRSALISATLSAGREDNCQTLRRNLHIRPEMLDVIPPIMPPWLTGPVTLRIPSPGLRNDGSCRFSPPHREARIEGAPQHGIWMGELSEYVRQVRSSSGGGGLVLCNSYADLDALATRLAGLPLFAVRKGMRFPEVLRAYYRSSIDGQLPLLLATGRAWTGMDIGGHRLADYGLPEVPASIDNVLTDLYVLRAPFGLNGTITHLNRLNLFGLQVESYSAAVLLKQGVGRLVRREGLPHNRRIHFLDGRVSDRRSEAIMRPCRLVLSAYENRASI